MRGSHLEDSPIEVIKEGGKREVLGKGCDEEMFGRDGLLGWWFNR